MSENYIDIEIIQVANPWSFQAREKPESAKSHGYRQFWKMQNDMNQYFKHSDIGDLYRCKVGEICAAISREDNQWHRVRIDGITSRAHGQQASCYMIDTGSQLTVSTLRLMKLPKVFQEFPQQIHQCSLWGVKPLTLTIVETDQGLNAENSPCNKWDPAAVEYMRKMVEGSQRCQAEIVDKDFKNTLFLRLYFITKRGRVCFNDALINEKYALKVDMPVGLMCKEETGTQDTALNDTITSLASRSTQPRSQSGLDDLPVIVPDHQKNDSQQDSLPTMTNGADSMTFSRSGLFGNGLDEQSLGYPQVNNNSPEALQNNLELSTEKVPDNLPISESISCSNSRLVKLLNLRPSLRSGRGDADNSQLSSDPTKSPLSSSKITKILSSVAITQTVTNSSPGRGRGFLPAQDSNPLPENNPVGLSRQYHRSPLTDHTLHANNSETSLLMAQEFHTSTGFLRTLIHCDGLIVSSEPDVPITTRQDKPVPQPRFGVIVHGKSVPSLICNVDDVPFEAGVKIGLNKMDIEIGKGIQPWVWPAALRCRHVVGICPPKLGKTVSFVPAIVTQILDRTNYIELPAGKGPLVLVLVPSWKKGRGVLEMVEAFKGQETSRKLIKSNVVYAGGMEENEHTQTCLLQGCDILIATPNSLLRLLDQDITSLKRLCHVILDDADLLATRFAKEVDAVMQLYKLQLKERREQKKCLGVPRQIMIFASQWNVGVEEFCLRYTVEPVIVISSRVEAAVYGAVRQVVTMTKQVRRLVTFCRLLDTLSNTEHRVAAFTQEVEEAKQMYHAVRSRGVYCLLIHEELESEVISVARDQWLYSSQSKQLMVMVCTDSCYEDLAIVNATMVVHYGLPDSKTKFGNRLACMMSYFLDRTSPIKPKIEPVSHIILTDKYADRAQSLYEILRRCPAEYPPQLEMFLQGYKMGAENDERRILCPFLKSFGICNGYDKCKHRHVVIPEQDFKTGEITQNTLPTSGEVKIKVMHVENASQYYCHIIDHRSVPENIRTDLRLEYLRLMMEMVSFFSKESNHVPYLPSDDPFLDGLCAFKESEDIFYRAKVLTVHKRSITAPVECKVWLVDAGYHQTGTIDQLLKLPQRLAEVPYQAVEVFLCCMKPMDNDSQWTYEANTFINSLIQGKELVGRIMLSVGLTLWLLPLVHQVSLKPVGLTSDKNIKQELLDNKFGIPNPKHIQKLYELFRGKTEIPEQLMRQYFDYALEMEMRQETLAECDTIYQVNIAAVISPELLYVQKWDNFDLLEKLEAQIAEIMKPRNEKCVTEKCKADAGIKLKRGSVCLALSSDSRWYRAKILTDLISGQFEVFFLDYGDQEKVSQSDIKPLPRELAELPCQAIECGLAYIQPYAGKWKEQAVGVICDLAYYVNGEKKPLLAKVVNRQEPHYGIGQKLVIDLYEENVTFSQVLVWRHMATPAEESNTLKNLLEKPALKNQRFFNIWDKVPYLCSNIYWSETHSEAIEQAHELHKILSCRDEGWDTTILEREVMESAFRVVGYIQDTEAHGILLDSVVSCCMESDRLTELAISQNFDCRLASCLEQVSRPGIQQQVAKAVAQLVNQRSFSEALTGCNPLVVVLEQFLKRHGSMPVQLETLRSLCSACAELVETVDESVCIELKSAEMVAYIFTILKQTSVDNEREPWLELLTAIATWKSSHKSLLREAHVATILDLLIRCSCGKCLFYLLSICELIVRGNRKNKVLLLENKLLIILKKLEAGGLGSPALEVCSHLQEKMALTLPQHEELAGVPAQQMTEVYKIVSPHVTWSQNCFRVLLNVKVQGLKVEDFVISSSSISCRSKSDGVVSEFSWELYDSILPAQSKVKVYASHSLVSLQKQTKGKWSRLLKQKIKLPNLSLNFEHPYDSDEEDVNNDENITKLTQPKDHFNQEDIWRVKRIRTYQSPEGSSDELAVYSDSSDDEPAIDLEALFQNIH